MAAPWPTLGHYRARGQPHSPDVNHCVLHFRPEGHREPRNEVGSLSPAEHLVGFEPGAFRFLLQCLNPLGHSPQFNARFFSRRKNLMKLSILYEFLNFRSYWSHKMSKMGQYCFFFTFDWQNWHLILLNIITFCPILQCVKDYKKSQFLDSALIEKTQNWFWLLFYTDFGDILSFFLYLWL